VLLCYQNAQGLGTFAHRALTPLIASLYVYRCMRTCAIENCNRAHHARGFCSSHYHDKFMKERDCGTCSIEGCADKIYHIHPSKGWCSKHYARWVRHGDPLKLVRKRGSNIQTMLDECDDIMTFEFKDRAAWGQYVKKHYGDKCQICGWCEATCDAHHKIPLSKGGQHTLENGRVLCPNCHRVEHSE